jgi:hypothetical protein
MTMTAYHVSTPRVAFGVSAAAMTALTIGVLVIMPARMEAETRDPAMIAAATAAMPASTVAGRDDPAPDVVAGRATEPDPAPCALSRSDWSAP